MYIIVYIIVSVISALKMSVVSWLGFNSAFNTNYVRSLLWSNKLFWSKITEQFLRCNLLQTVTGKFGVSDVVGHIHSSNQFSHNLFSTSLYLHVHIHEFEHAAVVLLDQWCPGHINTIF